MTMSNGTCANGSTTRSPTWPIVAAGRSLTIGPRQSPTQTHRLGRAVHSFRTLLDDLATVANNRVVAPDAKPFDLVDVTREGETDWRRRVRGGVAR